MACPSGCLNGAGQIKPAPKQTAAGLLDQLDHVYHHEQVLERQPQDNPVVHDLYAHWVHGNIGDPAARELLHTGYHKREKTVTATVADW